MKSNCTGTAQRLRKHFPGLAALVNFFDVAASRRATFKGGVFPQELYDRILDYVDYDTWKVCLLVSRELRSSCLLKYRLNDQVRIVAGPFVRLQKYHEERILSFHFENIQTGDALQTVQYLHPGKSDWSWMPVIGRDRRAVMLDTVIQFELASDVPVEADSDDDIP
ncbi:MAG: hypothetical protein M1821_007641 [Bathelium mastoideum]|nr:MAG: hypothetical protein M1821_007641 [Bathelium mastoideum]